MADAVEFLKRCLPPASPAVSGPEWVRPLCGGLVGIISQSDLIAALFSSRVLEPEATTALASDDGPAALVAAG